MAVKPIPDGYHSVTPYLIVKGAANAIDVYKKVFGAKELLRFPAPDGRIMHAELQIGDSVVMLADEFREMGHHSPLSLGGSPLSLMVYVEDVDAVAKRAEAAGMKVVRPVADQFYGDRSGNFQDSFGHLWTISTHKEDVSAEEMKKRAAAAQK